MAVRREPTLQDFLVLVVEDQERLREGLRDALMRLDGVFVVEADSLAKARPMVDRHYIDAAIVDLDLPEGETAGFGVLEKLEEISDNTPVVIWSNYLDDKRNLAKFVGSKRVIRIVRKGNEPKEDKALPRPRRSVERVVDAIGPLVRKWHNSRVTIENDKLVRELLWDRRKMEAYEELRGSRRELARELERVYRKLFGSISGLEKEGEAEVSVTFRPIEREGLSSAVTVEGEVTIGWGPGDEPVRGNRCVVKIGPIKEIAAEYERYERFVKFGVRLAQRVELLGYAPENLIGGIAYSFAGGVFGNSVMSFDRLLRRPDGRALAAQAVVSLFNPLEKNWYDVDCEKVSATDYVDESYKTDFGECFNTLASSLRGLESSYREEGFSFSEPGDKTPGEFLCPGGKLKIPPRNIDGANAIAPERAACLVHGDMHGGNVMVELGNGNEEAPPPLAPREPANLEGVELKRICLIDYRSAGPGPRAADAVALQISIRLADASAIAAKHSPGTEAHGTKEKELKGKALAKAVLEAANRTQAEEKFLKQAWQAEPDGNSVARDGSAPWAVAVCHLTARMRYTFPDMALDEYLPIAILCAIRQFGYGIGPLARVRLLAWLSALYAAL